MSETCVISQSGCYVELIDILFTKISDTIFSTRRRTEKRHSRRTVSKWAGPSCKANRDRIGEPDEPGLRFGLLRTIGESAVGSSFPQAHRD